MKYKKALEMNDEDVPSLISYGVLLQKDYKDSEAIYRKPLELDTTNVDALNYYALMKQNICKDYVLPETF